MLDIARQNETPVFQGANDIYAAPGAVADIRSRYVVVDAYSATGETVTAAGFTLASFIVTPFPSAAPKAIEAADYPALASVWANDADAIYDDL